MSGCSSAPSATPYYVEGSDRVRASHWSLNVPTRPDVPELNDAERVKNPIDLFILQKLAAEGLEPSPPEAPSRMLRRLTLDLRGLPPTPEEVRAFDEDPSEAAWQAAIERLLDEPAFGEQRAHYWLDVARFADTHGYHFDNYRSLWPYRDYVIDAFASGKPFDVFTIEQLAGDLLDDAGDAQRVATGFIRAGMTTNESGVNEDEYAAIYAKDRVDALAAGWLGLTVGCASCHDHKYDPITQEDFYGLSAFFRNTTQPVLDENRSDAPPTLLVGPDETPSLIVEENPDDEPAAFVLTRGRYDDPGKRVAAAVPHSLPPLPEGEPQNRLGLARWLVSADQPLTARVVVNRFWSELFGTGLVRTANDFGAIGERPSHPELLDWLAVEFRESGWDVKHLFRLMVGSATYRQSAGFTPDSLERDADNRLLSRGPRFRMDAEMVRDLALAASGLLAEQVGGPSVRTYQPDNLWDVVSLPESDTFSYEQDHGDALYRRSLYTFWKRQAPPPSLEAFNAPSRESPVVTRERTNTPLQALVGLNDVQLVEAARALATRALHASSDTRERLDFIALHVLARPLESEEQQVMQELAETQVAAYAEDESAVNALLHVGETAPPDDLSGAELAGWTLVANTFLNLDEALTK